MGRLKNEIDCEELFKRADCFLWTVRMFQGQPKEIMGVTAFAHILCYAFATEIYLKILSQLETSLPPLGGHDLKKLVNDVSPGSQKRLARAWLAANARTIKASKQRGDPDWMRIPGNFRSALSKSARAFIDWRYGEKTDVRHWSLGGVADETRQIILELRPDWRVTAGPRAELDPQPQLDKAKSDNIAPAAGWAVFNHKPAPIKLRSGDGTDPKDGCAD